MSLTSLMSGTSSTHGIGFAHGPLSVHLDSACQLIWPNGNSAASGVNAAVSVLSSGRETIAARILVWRASPWPSMWA